MFFARLRTRRKHLFALPAAGVLLFISALALSVVRAPVTPLRGLLQRAALPHLASTMLGFEGERTYLVLFQNHTELRPTGGFIGTYGVFKVRDARISDFFVESAGHLDRRAPPEFAVTPPRALERYLKINRWQFRDANWNPDFRVAAKEALWFYRMEGGKDAAKIDGVIAVTPVFLEYLLRVVGPVTVQGIEFTAENVTEQLEYAVEVGYETRGVPRPERKEIIGAFTTAIYGRITALSPLEWASVFAAAGRALNEKHLLLFDTDPVAQSSIESFGWDGGMGLLDEESDYLAVVDANLGGLKSDPAVHRSYEYAVRRDGAALTTTLVLHFDHRGTRDYKTGDYRTYTRVYVPRGATLTRAQGAHASAEGVPGVVGVYEEAGRSVFGFFLEVPLGSARTVSLTYTLPERVAEQAHRGEYRLFVRSQPGTRDRLLTMSVNFGKKVVAATPPGEKSRFGDAFYRITTNLQEDRMFAIRFK